MVFRIIDQNDGTTKVPISTSADASSNTVVIVPTLLWLAGFRFQWREDRRKSEESVVALAMRLVDQQRAELSRRTSDADALGRQIELLMVSRYVLQHAIDTLHDQVIAARVAIHDYERRLGLPETEFPPLPMFSLTDK